MNILSILNPRAGQRRNYTRIAARIREVFEPGAKSYEQVATEYPGHASEIARKAREQGYELILAMGGDGTVNEVASQLVGSECAFGVVPSGSGNGFARSLGISSRTIKAIESYRCFRTIRIDVGRMGEDFFFCTAGVGYDARIAWEFDRIHGSIRGVIPYFIYAMKSYFYERQQQVDVIIDGNHYTFDAFALTIANGNQYGAGAKIAPMASMDDGYLDIVRIPKFNLLTGFFHLPRLFIGNIHRVSAILYFRGQDILIKRHDSGLYHVDGESRSGGDSLHATILPKSLKVILPEAANMTASV